MVVGDVGDHGAAACGALNALPDLHIQPAWLIPAALLETCCQKLNIIHCWERLSMSDDDAMLGERVSDGRFDDPRRAVSG